MRKKGSFYTSTLSEEKLTFISLSNGELVVRNDLGSIETYQQNDDYAGWTLEYNGHSYEFCSSHFPAGQSLTGGEMRQLAQ